MRKFVTALVVMLGIMFVITRFAELNDIVRTLQQGDWRYLALAALIEVLWVINIGASFKTILRLLGVDEKLGRMVLTTLAANFINIIAPSAGVGGMAVMISEARARDYSTGKATVASTLFVLFDYIAFFMVLTLGFVVLLRRDRLTVTEIIASIILLLIAVALAAILYLGVRSERRLGGLLAWLAGLINRLVRPFRPKRQDEYLSVQRAHVYAREVAEGVRALRGRPRELIFPVVLAVNGKALMILVLYFVFIAARQPVSIGTIIASFCIAFLFTIVSPTPSGVGIVESLLTLALNSFYIPLGTAAVIALTYRAFTFWMPLLGGMVAFRWIGKPRAEVA